MIWYYLITFFSKFLSAIFATLHIPVVEELPLGIDGYLTTTMGYFREFSTLFPPLGVVFTAFMFYFGFRTTLLVLRLLRVIR